MLAVIVALVCAALAGMVATALSYRDTLLAAQESHLTTMALSASENLSNYFAMRQRELDGLFSPTQVDLARATQGGDFPEAMQRLLTTFGTPDACVTSVRYVSVTDDVAGGTAIDNMAQAAGGTARSSGGTVPASDASTPASTGAFVSRWWRDGDGYLLELRKPIIGDAGETRGWVCETIDLSAVYDRVLAPIQVGTHGYCTVKDPDRVIVMHRLASQIGVDTLYGRESDYPSGDWSDLVRVQYAGEAGCRVVTSYWWDDMQAGPVKKLIGYAPVRMPGYEGAADAASSDAAASPDVPEAADAKIFVVSVVMSYDELMSPLKRTIALLACLGALVLVAAVIGGWSLAKSLQNARSLRRELAYEQQIHAQAMRLRLQDRQMQQADRLQTAGVIASSFAHELKNLMTPLSIYGQMMGGGDVTDDERREMSGEIASIAARSSELLERMLSYVRHRTSSGTAVRHDASAVVAETTGTVRALVPRDVRLVAEVSEKPCWLVGNPGAMSQILLNLSTNALYAMRDAGGVLTVRWGPVDDGAAPAFRLTVADTGTGMDDETKARLFGTFFTTKGEEGTGLGMSVIQSLVQELHGSIAVESERGVGSTFVITIPQAVAARTADAARDGAAD